MTERRMKKSSPSSPSSHFIFLSALSIILSYSNVKGTSVCPYEPFPIDFLRNGGIWHIQGEFYMNFSQTTTVSLSIEYPNTYIRFSLQNYTGYNTYASISNTESPSIELLNTDSWGHFSGIISNTGKYNLAISGEPISSASGASSCPHGYIEFFARPQSTMITEIEFYSKEKKCGTTSVLPEIDLSNIENVHYVSDAHIDEGYDFYVVPDATGHIKTPWTFTVPSDASSSHTFSANLRTEFGSGGLLRILLQSNYSDFFPSDVSDCVKRNKCFVGTKAHLNSETLTTLLPPGNYSLWLYWGNDNSSAVSYNCIPFGLTVDIEPSDIIEGFIDCAARALPESLNGIGSETIDNNGRIHLHRAVLWESLYTKQSTTVTIADKSYLRIHLTSDVAADIDVMIMNTDTSSMVENSFRLIGDVGDDPSTSAPETISAILDAGNYEIIFMGSTRDPCTSFDLDLAIIPVAQIVSFCTGSTKTILPDLSGMSNLSSLQGDYHFNDGNSGFTYVYNSSGKTKYEQNIIVTQEFSTSQAKMFRARIGSNFVLNDITMSLENEATGEIMHPRHKGPNMQAFDLYLYPGTYIFRILSGLVQESFEYTEYPSCAVYTLSMDVDSLFNSSTADLQCSAYRELPATFNDGEWLDTSDSVFTLEEFRVPTLSKTSSGTSFSSWTGRSESIINTDVTSYLHIFITPQNEDLNIAPNIYFGSEDSLSTVKRNTDGSISCILNADTDYHLSLDFTHRKSSGTDETCLTYLMEIKIAPYSENDTDVCSTPKLPTSETVFPNSGVISAAFDHVDTYWMPRGTNDNVMGSLRFEVTQAMHFRALVLGDFLYSQLVLSLEGSGKVAGVQKSLLRGGYEISINSLPAGVYTLKIYSPYEDESIPEGPLRTACIEALLHIAAEPVYIEKSNVTNSVNCKYTSVPETFNTPGFTHMLTEYHSIINGRYRANIDDGYDFINMNFEDEMIYRVLIPDARKGSALDVDIGLYTGTSEVLGDLVDSSINSESADVIYGIIQPGTYVLKFSYWGTGAAYPYGGCISFPIYAEFAPLEAYEATGNCSEITFPSEVIFDKKVSETCKWSPSAEEQYIAMMPLEIMSDAARVRVEVTTNNFIPDGLTFLITGRTSSGLLEVSARADALVGAGGRAWLDEYLLTGSYTIYITDSASRSIHGAVSHIGCAEYNITYHIDTTVDPESEGVCTVAEDLPTDIYTEYGGSIDYGGPQAEDGTVLVVGEHFLLPHDMENSVRWTQLMVSEASFIRVFARTIEPNDVCMYLYRDRDNASSFIAMSMNFEGYENTLWYYDPNENDVSVTLDLGTDAIYLDESKPCNYFQWAVGVRPRSKAAKDIACPAVLPLETERVPPETIRITESGTIVPSSSKFIFTSTFINTHTDGDNFVYRMTLDASKVSSASVSVELSFNFLLSDLHLVLRDYQTEEKLSSGVHSSLPNRHGSLNFRSTFSFVLSQGKYYLDIMEDISGKAVFLNTTYCMPFDFVLTATVYNPIPEPSSSSDSSAFVVTVPEISYVDPQTIWGIEPCGNIYIDVHFNEKPANLPNNDLKSFLNTQGMIVMSDSDDPSGAAAFPIDYAALSENAETDWVLGLRFAGDNLNLGHVYTLRVNASAFLNIEGESFTDPAVAAGAEYQYFMATCNCSGHGTCAVTGIISECIYCDCDDPWTGLECAACKKGYHISADGSTCIPDPVCGPDSCSGHGTCDSSTGSIVCTCDTGYASPTSTSGVPCSLCAIGYTGYPDCVYDDNAVGADCEEPLLPSSLSTVPYMGWKGYVDISDTFHVDLDSLTHDIEFELDRDSLFRVFAVPNSDFDVDLWLYKVNQGDGSLTPVAFEVSMDSAEAMFETLNGGPSGEVVTKYLLRMRFYDWSNYDTDSTSTTTTSSCKSMDLSLSIAPIDAMHNALGDLTKYCAPEDDLPSIPFTEISDNATYAPGRNFTIHPSQSFTLEPRYFWSHDFIAVAQGYHTIMLQAHVGSRFLSGQITMMLERYPDNGDEPNHCSDGSKRCVVGEGTLNGHFLHRALQDGKYRLWLLEPALQDSALTNCSLFDFSFRVEYLDVTTSVFECDGDTGVSSISELPSTLNAPGYLDDSGTVHVNDRFTIYGNASTVSFEISEKSYFRVANDAQDVDNDGTLFAICTENNTCSSYETELLHELIPGRYTMHVKQPINWHDGRINKCVVIALELAIEPVSRTVIAPCPTHATDPDPEANLPDFEVHGAPFSYGTDENGEYKQFMASAPYRRITSRVAQYTIEITESSTLDASVMSSFLYHSLGMSLYMLVSNSQLHVISSHCVYNTQRLRALLIPGTYLLTLDVPEIARPGSFPSCLPFNFEIKVLPYSDESATCQLSGEPIPHSLNGYRFGNKFNFLSTEFRVPYGLYGTETVKIPFNITADFSLVNIYVAPNTIVDIDVGLLDSQGNLIAAGFDMTYTEESFAIVVPKGKYTLVMALWNWGDKPVSGCQTFTMQISVTPDYAAQSCPSGSEEEEEWPPEYPKEIENEYEYTSGFSALWYKHVKDEKVNRTYNFHLDHTSDFAAQTHYTFQVGQLGLILQRITKDEETGESIVAESHYGEHGNGRSTLKALGVPAGDYVLTIYEPTVPPSEMVGCSYFGFTTLVRRKRAYYLTEDMRMPDTLNSIPYLGFDHSMHTQDTFVLFRGREQEETTFTIYKQSIAHIHAILQTEFVRNKFLNLTITKVLDNGTYVQVAEGTTELHVALETGEYRLTIINNGEVLEMEGGGVLSDIEISIQPVTKIREVVAGESRPSSCADSLVPAITISPDGYYFYDADDDVLAVSYATFSKASRVQRLKLEIKVPSRVYAQIGYEYALGNLDLEITKMNDNETRAVGIQQRNFNIIRATLEIGTYYLDILNPTPPPSLKEPLEYCFPFTFVISVIPTSKGGSGGGCLFKDTVPWDLNRYDGGSIRFGGPIDSAGSLLLYGDTFAVPSGVTSNEIAFSVKEDSALSILLTAGMNLVSIHAHLYDAVTRKLINPLGSAELAAGSQQLITFAVTTANNTGGSYYIVLHYGETSGDCAEFTMQIEIKAMALLKSALICDEGFEPGRLPLQKIVPDDHGFARDVRASSFYSDEPIATVQSPYDIDLAVNTTSSITTTLSFSPMTNLYALNLIAKYSDRSYVRSTATLRTQSLMSSDLATVTLSLSDTLAVSPSYSQMSYKTRISQDNWTSPAEIGKLPPKKLCYPYIYTAYVIPDNGLPYIKEVSPAGARELSPSETFTIYVTFSKAVYEAGTDLVEATEETIKKTFYLYDRKSSSTATHIFPESCVKVSSDTSCWGITFISDDFKPLIDYQLGFVEGNLVDSTPEEVKYVFVNIYHTIDTTCNAHGKLVENNTCLCDEGYAGQTCQACDVGYVNVGIGTTGKDIRCIPSMTCEENTCGCDYDDDTQQTCNPLGECQVNSSTGVAHCVCKEGYRGTFCHRCIEGWDGWPRCIPCFNGASWDKVKNRCICAGNFAGPKCQKCKFGYSGKNCETYGGAIFAILLGFIIIVLSFVIFAIITLKVRSVKTHRTYQRVLTTTDGEGYDDELDNDDDDDWMSSPVPSAAVEGKKHRTFTIRKADNKLFSDDGYEGSINNYDTIDDNEEDFFAGQKESK